jgi:RNA polymerase sigma factor (sigma-70 family)
LYEPGSPLLEYASHLATTGVDGHEIVQDVIGDLVAHDAIEDLQRYAMRSARRRALNARRHERIYAVAAGEIAALADDAPDILSRLIDAEHNALLHEAINQLPDDMKLVVHLVDFHGLSRNEVAFLLGVEPPRITYLRKRAMQSLRTVLAVQQCA